jgi:rod shape-determining protein MreD
MRDLAVIVVGIILVVIQGNLYHLFSALGLHGFTPSFVLPIVVFLGANEHSLARGALLSFALGHAVDLLAGAPVGLFTFIYVVLWGLAKVAGVRLTAQARFATIFLAFLFTLVEGFFVLILLTIFGADAQRPVEIAKVIVPHAAGTGIVSPLVFKLAQRLHQGTKMPRAPEGAG